MIPVTCVKNEIDDQKILVDKVYAEVCQSLGIRKIPFMYGTMIEIPRAALTAKSMAETAEFFSFGTNDLTQMGFGFSRDDIGSFLPDYLTKKILPADPFQTLDQEGIGELIKFGIERGRLTRPGLKVGICGEHGGDPDSVKFCHRVGMNYVSCSPFRVPIARLAAAQAAIEEKNVAKVEVMKTAKSKKTESVKVEAAKPAAKKAVKPAASKKTAPVKKAGRPASAPVAKKAAKAAVVKKAASVKKAAKPAAKKAGRPAGTKSVSTVKKAGRPAGSGKVLAVKKVGRPAAKKAKK